ncbi:MAG: UDP-N-acetylmuramoyl-tripeptide--D-alanyl-D-alanine ligase [Clostridiales bacterium]|nr:UDP-N-acetylmuramoyl-tripeptide--D-alanyl-D-alanine ligase [Clostridiales bacterium]
MKPLSIKEVIDAIDGQATSTGTATVITGVSTDSRTIQPGDLFVPLEGENFDGHDYIMQAVEKGAVAVLTHNLNKTLPQGVHTIVTRNTLKALQELAAWYLKSLPIPIIAVTGSTGKTTTKDFISLVLSKKYQVLKTQGNFNNEIGLPMTLFQLEPHHEIGVLEMGMSGIGEISRLAAIAPPKAVVFTNIGVSHIENLGSRDNIWKAKSEVLEQLHEGCSVFLNDDNDILHREAKHMIDSQTPYKVLRYGTSNEADYRAENIQLLGEAGITYNVVAGGKTWPIHINVPGRHNVLNSLAAIAAGRAFGVEMADIQEALPTYTGGNMRLDIFSVPSLDDVKVIDDAYNASPDSVQAALKILEDMKSPRKIAVLGDMLELGEYTNEAHQLVGKWVANSGINVLITIGRAGIWTIDGANNSGMEHKAVFHKNSNAEIIQWLKENLQHGDRVLVKGSRGLKMEEIVSYLRQGRDSN